MKAFQFNKQNDKYEWMIEQADELTLKEIQEDEKVRIQAGFIETDNGSYYKDSNAKADNE
ncbi:hypothetical protein BKH41_08530 [Helicobacter sp. 12S02232-10]|uniref:hypothetical protein n=1 Tax=Helicobacter sp. 12S02232-10 TaxID=1476197 RepID=UPI000BA5AFAB|nr:hypothetical protein [Helicobacter sp. 12S02232-10]PAF46745.1 hypothetical protein BKH41_08530 [Helicobacter sp. 12S02232-10]